MKRILIGLLSGVMVFSLISCGESKETVTKEPQEQKEEEKVVNTIPEMKVGEPFLIKTERGDYEFTINSLKKTDERNQFDDTNPKQVIILEYTYKNISFTDDSGVKLLVDQSAFTVLDGEGNVLRTYPASVQYAKLVPVGAKCTASIAYGVPTDSDTITVRFERNNKPVGEAIIKI